MKVGARFLGGAGRRRADRALGQLDAAALPRLGLTAQARSRVAG